MLETWFKHINSLRAQSHQYQHEKIEDDFRVNKEDICIECEENLKRCSSPKFCRWQMKHHSSTLTQYVHLKNELERQLKWQWN